MYLLCSCFSQMPWNVRFTFRRIQIYIFFKFVLNKQRVQKSAKKRTFRFVIFWRIWLLTAECESFHSLYWFVFSWKCFSFKFSSKFKWSFAGISKKIGCKFEEWSIDFWTVCLDSLHSFCLCFTDYWLNLHILQLDYIVAGTLNTQKYPKGLRWYVSLGL